MQPRHEKKVDGRYLPFPPLRQGHGHLSETKDEEGADFKIDEKTGLFLPAGTAKERRKVKTGFQPK